MEKETDIINRASELMQRAEYEPAVSKFLTPQESIIITRELRNPQNMFLWGGCIGAERKCAVFLPEWYTPDIPVSSPDREKLFGAYLASEEGKEVLEALHIRAVKISGSGFRNLRHKDFMGSVLSLGIDRNMTGDILVLSSSEALIFVIDTIADYIISELKLIGRDGVRCTYADIAPDYTAEREFEDMLINVQSMRLDGIVSHLTNASRGEAAEMIVSGLVELNYFVSDDVSATVNENDIISVRGYGKYIVGKAGEGTTRSGKLRLHCRKYK